MFAHTSQVQVSSSSAQSLRPIGEPTRALNSRANCKAPCLLPRLCASRDRQRHASARIPGPLPHVAARVRQHSVGRCDGAWGRSSMRTSSPWFVRRPLASATAGASLANSSQLFHGGSGNCSRRNPLVRRDLLVASHRREPPESPFLMTILGLACCSVQWRPMPLEPFWVLWTLWRLGVLSDLGESSWRRSHDGREGIGSQTTAGRSAGSQLLSLRRQPVVRCAPSRMPSRGRQDTFCTTRSPATVALHRQSTHFPVTAVTAESVP